MRKLVLKSFQGRKRELRVTIVILTITFLCGIMTILFLESFYRSKESLRYDTYGEWTGAVLGVKEETEQFVNEMEYTKQTGKVVMLGSSWNKGKRFGYTGFVDKAAQKLGRLKLLDGKFPTKPTEVALSETAVNRLPETVHIGDKIELALSEDGKTKSYTLSGIVKSWGREWRIEGYELPSVILGEDETLQGETYLLFQNNNSDELKRIQEHAESRKETYVYNEKAYPLDINILDEFFQDGKFVYFIVLIALILICYLMTLTLKSRRYSLTILRGLGADAKEVLQIVMWETLLLWGISFLASVIPSVLLSGVALYVVHVILKMPVNLKIQVEFLLEYIICVTVFYFVYNLAIVLIIILSQIRTTFKSDSGVLDCTTLPKLKKTKQLTFFMCLKRKWRFYNKIYIGRFVISIVVIMISAISLQYFIEEKNRYEHLMGSMEYNYHYYADSPETGLTEEQIEGIKAIDGVKSIEIETYINCSTMTQNVDGIQDIKISASVFQDSEYVDVHRKYTQRNRDIPVDQKGGYFSVHELRGISSKDQVCLSSYEKWADAGTFARNRFLAGEECVLILSPYQIRDLGSGKAPLYVNCTPKEKSKKVYTYEMNEHRISPGDIVNVSTPWGEREIRVGAVITSPDADLDIDANVIAVSETFVNYLCGFEQPRYMGVKINLDETIDMVRTGEKIEGYFETLEQGKENLTDTSSVIKEAAQTAMFEGAEYLFVLAAVWLLYMLTMYYGNQIYLKNEGKRIGVLRAYGMDKSVLHVRYLLENTLEGIVVILASVVGITAEFLIRLNREAPYDSWNMFMQVLNDNQERIQFFMISLLIAIFVFVGVSCVTLYLPLKAITDKEIVENLSDCGKIN